MTSNALVVRPRQFELSDEQWRFLALHARRLVTKWKWHFGSSLLRAYTDDGHTATVSAAGVDEMIRAGLCHRQGDAGVKITPKGREAVK